MPWTVKPVMVTAVGTQVDSVSASSVNHTIASKTIFIKQQTMSITTVAVRLLPRVEKIALIIIVA